MNKITLKTLTKIFFLCLIILLGFFLVGIGFMIPDFWVKGLFIVSGVFLTMNAIRILSDFAKKITSKS